MSAKKKTSEILTQAYGLFKSMPYRGAFAAIRGVDGTLTSCRELGLAVQSTDSDVAAVCSLGALYRVCARKSYSTKVTAERFLEDAAYLVGNTDVTRINDRRPRLVDAMWLKAIELAQAKEGKLSSKSLLLSLLEE